MVLFLEVVVCSLVDCSVICVSPPLALPSKVTFLSTVVTGPFLLLWAFVSYSHVCISPLPSVGSSRACQHVYGYSVAAVQFRLLNQAVENVFCGLFQV